MGFSGVLTRYHGEVYTYSIEIVGCNSCSWFPTGYHGIKLGHFCKGVNE